MNNIFVGNLSFKTTKEDIVTLFEPFGVVADASVVEKKGQSLGYGFVDMPDVDERQKAIAALHDKDFMGRIISVSVVIARVRHKKKSKHIKPVEKVVKKEYVKPERRETKRPVRAGSKLIRKDEQKSKPWSKSPSGARPYYKNSTKLTQ